MQTPTNSSDVIPELHLGPFRMPISVVGLAILVTSCNFSIEKNPGGTPAGAFGSIPGFAQIKSEILEPRCASCHNASSSLNLGQLAVIQSQIPRIQAAVAGNRMPPGGMPGNLKAVLLAWLSAGAPEFPVIVSPGPSTSPPPQPSTPPLVAEFDSLNFHIFQRRCVSCHRAGGSAGFASFESYESLMATDLIDLQNPTQSEILHVLLKDDQGLPEMPPPQSGFPPVSDSEISALLTWIQKGAKK